MTLKLINLRNDGTRVVGLDKNHNLVIPQIYIHGNQVCSKQLNPEYVVTRSSYDGHDPRITNFLYTDPDATYLGCQENRKTARTAKALLPLFAKAFDSMYPCSAGLHHEFVPLHNTILEFAVAVNDMTTIEDILSPFWSDEIIQEGIILPDEDSRMSTNLLIYKGTDYIYRTIGIYSSSDTVLPALVDINEDMWQVITEYTSPPSTTQRVVDMSVTRVRFPK